MEWYGLLAAGLIALAFYGVRRVPAFLLCGAAIVAVFTAITYPSLAVDRVSEWRVMTTGLVASIAGLMFVRFMLIRSVSLQLLARIGDVADGACRHEISERMNDMRTLRLVRVANDRNTLTLAGRFVAEVAASVYYIFGIET